MDLLGKTVDYRFRDRIAQVRGVFKEKIKKLQDDQLVYQQDVDKTMTNDFWVEKFLEWNKGYVNKTADNIVFSCKYIKKYRLRDLKMSDFASEIISSGSVFEYEPDVLGRKTLYFRMKYAPACKETREITKQLFSYIHFKMEEESGEKGYVCINDFAGGSISNVDMKLAFSSIEVTEVFPHSCVVFIAVNVPFFLKGAVKSVMYMLPGDQMKGVYVLNQDQLPQVIPVENLPDFLGGTSKRPYSGNELVPEGCVTLKEQFDKLLTDESNQEDDKFVIRSESAVMFPEKTDKNTASRVEKYYHDLFSQ